MGFSICWFSESSDHCLIVIRLLPNSEAMVYLFASKLHLQDTVRRGKTKLNEQTKRLDFRLCFNIAWILMSEKKEKIVVSGSVSSSYSLCPQLNE